MKNILYATDYSENSIAALNFAHFFAEKLNAKLLVMHVFDIPVSVASPVSISYIRKEKRLFAEHRAKLEDFCAEHLGDKLKTINLELLVDEDGSTSDGIIEKVIDHNVDLAVVGTKGASAVKEFIFGSTAKALIRKAPCAVLAVPETSNTKYCKTIVYASDFEKADIFAIRRLAKIAEAFDAIIRVIHITTKKEYVGDQQLQWFKEMVQQKVDYNKLEYNLIYSENIYEKLLSSLLEKEADLLVMLERKDKGVIRKLFDRDMVLRMESNIGIPLLSYSVGVL
ncbi:universal stress protein [Maribacter halichondriae]|uniref:universal stress protein n=1 Tax=Maribacter halichondriae TaxID=2980554 RepID=UPI002359741A|nr:universal stress protein [Maribacter sp. Hal144]